MSAAPRPRVRLRQAVLVTEELEPAAQALSSALALGEPFRDPGVAEFGLANAVFAVGDCFIELISPTRAGTAAGRYLERHGGGGYMAIFDLEDLDSARERALGMGVRVVWQIDLPDIAGTHLHPADTRGAIVSLDRSTPYGAWRWGGPQWTGRIADPEPGGLAGIAVAVSEPDAVADRWGDLVGVAVSGGVGVSGGEGPRLSLDGGQVSFRHARGELEEGIVEIALELPAGLPDGGESIELCGVRVRRVVARVSP